MAMKSCLWRHGVLLGTILLLGLVAGAVWGSGSSAGSAVLVVAVVGTLGLAWKSGRSWDRSLNRMEQFVATWTRTPRAAETLDSTIPELDPLLQSLLQSQSQLEAERRQNLARVADLNQQSRLLDSVLGAMAEAVIVVDPDARLLFLNAAARGLFEAGERVEPGRLLHEIVRSPQLQELVALVLAAGGQRERELILSRTERDAARGLSATIAGVPTRSGAGDG